MSTADSPINVTQSNFEMSKLDRLYCFIAFCITKFLRMLIRLYSSFLINLEKCCLKRVQCLAKKEVLT